MRNFINKLIGPAIWIAIIGGLLLAVFRPWSSPDPDADKTWTLVMLSYGVALVPGYENMAACKAASQQLREQIEASPPVTACIVAGSKDPYR